MYGIVIVYMSLVDGITDVIGEFTHESDAEQYLEKNPPDTWSQTEIVKLTKRKLSLIIYYGTDTGSQTKIVKLTAPRY